MAVGSRAHLQAAATAKRSWYRNLLMRGFHLLVVLVAGSAVKDTQCGFKARSAHSTDGTGVKRFYGNVGKGVVLWALVGGGKGNAGLCGSPAAPSNDKQCSCKAQSASERSILVRTTGNSRTTQAMFSSPPFTFSRFFVRYGREKCTVP